MFTPQMIRKLRERLGLSVIEFAERLGVDRQAVYLWESGLRHPKYSNLERLNDLADDERVAKVG